MTNELSKEEPEMTPESSASVKISLDRPEMALLQGGLFVVSVPLNAKGVNKIIALGMVYNALDRLCSLYRDTDKMKAEHEARKRKGDLSLVKKIADIGNGISNLVMGK